MTGSPVSHHIGVVLFDGFMTLAYVGHHHGHELALRVADGAEHEWHVDPTWDPFAVKAGLV